MASSGFKRAFKEEVDRDLRVALGDRGHDAAMLYKIDTEVRACATDKLMSLAQGVNVVLDGFLDAPDKATESDRARVVASHLGPDGGADWVCVNVLEWCKSNKKKVRLTENLRKTAYFVVNLISAYQKYADTYIRNWTKEGNASPARNRGAKKDKSDSDGELQTAGTANSDDEGSNSDNNSRVSSPASAKRKSKIDGKKSKLVKKSKVINSDSENSDSSDSNSDINSDSETEDQKVVAVKKPASQTSASKKRKAENPKADDAAQATQAKKPKKTEAVKACRHPFTVDVVTADAIIELVKEAHRLNQRIDQLVSSATTKKE